MYGKNITLRKNDRGGIDFTTARPNGIPAQIATGKAADSIQYWEEMKRMADAALTELRKPQVLHTVIIHTNARVGKKAKMGTRIVRI